MPGHDLQVYRIDNRLERAYSSALPEHPLKITANVSDVEVVQAVVRVRLTRSQDAPFNLRGLYSASSSLENPHKMGSERKTTAKRSPLFKVAEIRRPLWTLQATKQRERSGLDTPTAPSTLLFKPSSRF